MLGEQIGVSRNDLDKLNWTALTDDVGKLEVPEELLNNPGRQTAGEWMVLLCRNSTRTSFVASWRSHSDACARSSARSDGSLTFRT